MEKECTIVEKLIDGEVHIRDYDVNADFDNDEIRALLDEHVIEPRMIANWRASDLIIDGVMSYEEYPLANFSYDEQIRQLERGAVGKEEFFAKADLEYFDDDDWRELLKICPEAAARRKEVDHE